MLTLVFKKHKFSNAYTLNNKSSCSLKLEPLRKAFFFLEIVKFQHTCGELKRITATVI